MVSSDPGRPGWLLPSQSVTSGTFKGAIWSSCHRGSSAYQLAWREGQRWGWTFISKSSQCDSFPCRWRLPAAPHPHAPRSFPAFEAVPGAEPWSPLVGPRPVSQPCVCVYVCLCVRVRVRSAWGSGPAQPVRRAGRLLSQLVCCGSFRRRNLRFLGQGLPQKQARAIVVV